MKSNFAIIFLFVYCFSSCRDNKIDNELNKVILLKTDSIKILNNKIDTLTNKNISLENDLNYWFSEEEIDKLKEKGIIDPKKELIDWLYKNPQLIPYPGVLGGTMRFWRISLLGNKWVIADFDDGHIKGEMLLKYTIQKDTTIKWTLLDHYLD